MNTTGIMTPIRVRIENWGGRQQTDPDKVVTKVIDILPYKEACKPKYINIKIGIGADRNVRQAHLMEAWQYLLRVGNHSYKALKDLVKHLALCSASPDFDGRGENLDSVIYGGKAWYQTRTFAKRRYIPTKVFVETSEEPMAFYGQGDNGDCVHCPHYFGYSNYCDYYKMVLNGNGYEPTCQN